jgi:hypothetical protein
MALLIIIGSREGDSLDVRCRVLVSRASACVSEDEGELRFGEGIMVTIAPDVRERGSERREREAAAA